jgi:hypothetical protein
MAAKKKALKEQHSNPQTYFAYWGAALPQPAPDALQEQLLAYAKAFPPRHWRDSKPVGYRHHYRDVHVEEKHEGAIWAARQGSAIGYVAVNMAQNLGLSIEKLGKALERHPWLAKGSDGITCWVQQGNKLLTLNTSVDDHESCYNITFFTKFGRSWEIGYTKHGDCKRNKKTKKVIDSGWRHAWIMPKGADNTVEEGMAMGNLLCHLMGYFPIFDKVPGYFNQDALADSGTSQPLAAASAPSQQAAPPTPMPLRAVPIKAPVPCHLDAQALEAQHPGDSVPLRPTPVKACPPHAPAPSAQHPAHLDALAPTAQHPGSADKHQVQFQPGSLGWLADPTCQPPGAE